MELEELSKYWPKNKEKLLYDLLPKNLTMQPEYIQAKLLSHPKHPFYHLLTLYLAQ
jgi:hypothetical protein